MSAAWPAWYTTAARATGVRWPTTAFANGLGIVPASAARVVAVLAGTALCMGSCAYAGFGVPEDKVVEHSAGPDFFRRGNVHFVYESNVHSAGMGGLEDKGTAHRV